MTTVRHSILGLPGSGKTTFLAALWHLLDADEVPTKYVLESLVGDRTHLNAITEAWRRCEVVPRTSLAAEINVSIHIKELSGDKKAILLFTDLSGESFQQQLSTRSCTVEYRQSLDESSGILLFISADLPTENLQIAALPNDDLENDVLPQNVLENDDVPLAQNTVEDCGVSQDSIEKDEKPIEWSPEFVQTQVKLVELLQFTQQKPFLSKPRRVAVVLSAWDTVKSERNPEIWFKNQHPLLHQFLVTNAQSFAFRVYGISAQGGDVDDTAVKSELIVKTPSHRIACVGLETDAHDLTSPLVWLMSSE